MHCQMFVKCSVTMQNMLQESVATCLLLGTLCFVGIIAVKPPLNDYLVFFILLSEGVFFNMKETVL